MSDRATPGPGASRTTAHLVAVTPAHGPVVAALQQAAFVPRGERAWSTDETTRLLASPGLSGVLLVAGPAAPVPGLAPRPDLPEPLAVLLLRETGREAEVVTLAVRPDHQGQGWARRLMTAGLADLAARGVARVVLEVAEDNRPALRLYCGLGFDAIGRRRAYYQRRSGPLPPPGTDPFPGATTSPPAGPIRRVDALVLACALPLPVPQGGEDPGFCTSNR